MSADMTTFMYLDLVLTIFKEEWGKVEALNVKAFKCFY